MTRINVETEISDIKVSLETGRIAKQADGSVIARIGDTMVLATVCSGSEADSDFFPLTVEYVEKTYAAGKIPGGFVKREGKPSEKEILSARIVDRPIRPLFPKGYKTEVQIVCTVISADDNYDADVIAVTAASSALCVSDLPFREPVACVRVGLVDGQLKVFPSLAQTEAGDLDLVVAGTEDSIMMVEGGCTELSEELLIEALLLAHKHIKDLVALQKELIAKVGKPPKEEYPKKEINPEIMEAVNELVKDRIHEISFSGNKKERYRGLDALREEVQTALAEKFPESAGEIDSAFTEIERKDIRQTILDQGIRIGGRKLDEIRNITCELDILPRAHGSALFTRGETQALVATTLGTKLDEQHIDSIQGEYDKSYMLHYNFPLTRLVK